MCLFSMGGIVKVYPIPLGPDLKRHKQQERDEITPEVIGFDYKITLPFIVQCIFLTQIDRQGGSKGL